MSDKWIDQWRYSHEQSFGFLFSQHSWMIKKSKNCKVPCKYWRKEENAGKIDSKRITTQAPKSSLLAQISKYCISWNSTKQQPTALFCKSNKWSSKCKNMTLPQSGTMRDNYHIPTTWRCLRKNNELDHRVNQIQYFALNSNAPFWSST